MCSRVTPDFIEERIKNRHKYKTNCRDCGKFTKAEYWTEKCGVFWPVCPECYDKEEE